MDTPTSKTTPPPSTETEIGTKAPQEPLNTTDEGGTDDGAYTDSGGEQNYPHCELDESCRHPYRGTQTYPSEDEEEGKGVAALGFSGSPYPNLLHCQQERRSFISDGKRSRRVAFADEVTEGAGSKDQVQVQEAGEESTQEQADTPPPKKAKTTSVWDLLL